MYSYRGFAKAAILLQNFLNTISKELFKHTLYVHTSEFQHFWIPTFDKNYQKIILLIFNILLRKKYKI